MVERISRDFNLDYSRIMSKPKNTKTKKLPVSSKVSVTPENIDSKILLESINPSPQSFKPQNKWKFEFPGNNVAPKVEMLEKALEKQETGNVNT